MTYNDRDQHDNISADEIRLLAPYSYGMRRTAIAKHPNTPADVLEDFYRDNPSKYVRTALAGNENTPGWILDELYENADGFVLTGLAKNASISAERVLAISYRSNPYALFQAVRNRNLPVWRVKELVGDANEWVNWGAKQRLYGFVPLPETPGGRNEPTVVCQAKRSTSSATAVADRNQALQDRLDAIDRAVKQGQQSSVPTESPEAAKRKKHQVAEAKKLRSIAETLYRERDYDGIATCEVEVLRYFLSHWGRLALPEGVRLAMLRNPNLSVWSLNELISTKSVPVRLAILEHPNVTEEVVFAMRAMVPMRLPLARHHLTPITLLQGLSKDTDKEVAEAASQSLTVARENLRAHRINEELGDGRQTIELADDIYCSPDHLELIAQCDNPAVLTELTTRDWHHSSALGAVAANIHTPQDVVIKLAAIKSPNIRLPLAASPSIPVSVQMSFLDSKSKPLLATLAANQMADHHVLAVLATKKGEVGEVARQTLHNRAN